MRQLFLTILSVLVLQPVLSQITMLSSNPLKKNDFLFFNTYQYYKNTEKYNWESENWDKLNDTLNQSFHKTLTMVGYGLNDRLSFFIQLPVNYFVYHNESKFYMDDIVVMTRYALIPSSPTKTGLTIIGAVRFPTGKTGTDKNFADGSTDFIIGGIMSTRWYGNWRTHVKSDFTFQTKNEKKEKIGNTVNVILKQDYKIRKIKLSLSNQYSYQWQKKDESDNLVDKSEKTRLTHTLQLEYKTPFNLAIKPKFQIPSYSVGGSNYQYKIIMELVYII